jgi:prophage antirepressor-like protein
MEQSLIPFAFEGQEVRIVMQEGEPWFVASDVCEVLDIKNVSQAVNGNPSRNEEGLDDDEKGIYNVYTNRGYREMLCVSEPGLYALIRKSHKPVAKALRRWIDHEVLPTLRKYGTYTVGQDQPLQGWEMAAINAPDLDGEIAHSKQRSRELAQESQYERAKAQFLRAAKVHFRIAEPQKMLEAQVKEYLQFLQGRRVTASQIRQYGPAPLRRTDSAAITKACMELVASGDIQKEHIAGKVALRFYVPGLPESEEAR